MAPCHTDEVGTLNGGLCYQRMCEWVSVGRAGKCLSGLQSGEVLYKRIPFNIDLSLFGAFKIRHWWNLHTFTQREGFQRSIRLHYN